MNGSAGRFWVLIALWGLICVLPALFLRQAFHDRVARERAGLRVTAEKSLRAELSRFQLDLKMDIYIDRCLGFLPLARRPDRYEPELLKGVPLPDSVEAFSALRKRVRNGVRSDLLYALMYEGKSGRWRFWVQPHFRNNPALRRLGEAVAGRYFMNAGVPDARHQVLERSQRRIFEEAFGVIAAPAGLDSIVNTKFSRFTQDRIFDCTVKFFGPTRSSRLAGLLVLGFRESDLRPRAILKGAVAKSSHPLKRSFGLLSHDGRPFFRESASGLSYYSPVTGRLQHLLARSDKQGAGREGGKRSWMLRVRVPAAQLEPPSARWLNTVESGCQGFVFLTGLLLLFGFRSPPPLLGRLRIRIALTFLLGASLPAAGLGWLAFSYLDAERRITAEETLDFMVTELERADRLMQWQNQHTMLQAEQVRRWLNIWFTRNRQKTREFIRWLIDPSELKSVFMTTNDGREFFYTENTEGDVAQRVSFLFKGVFLETLFGRGSFAVAGLKRNDLERLQTNMSVFLSILERNLEAEFYSGFLMYPGLPLENQLSMIFERFTSFSIGPAGAPPVAVGIFHSTYRTMSKGFFAHFQKHPWLLSRDRQGFRITTHFYPTQSADGNDLTRDWPGNTIPAKHDLYKRLFPMAEASLRSRVNIRLNDLDSSVPRLFASRFFWNGETVGVSEAVPLQSVGRVQMLGFAVGLAAYGLLLAGVLGGLTAFGLTRPFPALLQALRATAGGRFDWTIDLARRDELGELGESFNHMAVGLQEGERMRRYVSDDVLEAVSSDDDNRLKPGGERVEVTVLFSDIRSFTTLSETHPAEEIVAMLNRYFAVMEREIRAEGGVLDKFIGDAVQAVFREKPDTGGDVPDNGDGAALRASRAALAMRRALAVFNKKRLAEGTFPIQSGIGLASGAVVSGRIGSAQGRLDFTVVGPPVLRAARLEAASKLARHTGIILDRETIAKLGIRARITPLEVSARPLDASEEIGTSGIGELLGLS